ncbi:MAG: putative damage-inducible protein DinB [Patiriisocius sp.]|jgi:uncharacterized damage-inducible protein DinB
MNINLFVVLVGISPKKLSADCGAFFGSISGTLNRILVADVIWRALRAPEGKWT